MGKFLVILLVETLFESEGELSCSQEPAIRPYGQKDPAMSLPALRFQYLNMTTYFCFRLHESGVMILAVLCSTVGYELTAWCSALVEMSVVQEAKKFPTLDYDCVLSHFARSTPPLYPLSLRSVLGKVVPVLN
jgi:hypothetical protein